MTAPGSATRTASASTDRSGSSSTGRGCQRTTSSASSASRTSPTTSGPGMSNVVYVVDSGRGSPAPPASRRRRPGLRRTAASGSWSSTRRIPKLVTSLSILIEGDDMPVKTADRDPPARQHRVDRQRPVHHRGPGFEPAVQFTPDSSTDPAATTARLWQYNLATGIASVAAQGQPVRRRGPDRRRRHHDAGQPRRLGIERHRRRVRGLRAGRVPHRRPGRHPVGREGARATTTSRRPAPTSPTSAQGGQLLLVRIPNG